MSGPPRRPRLGAAAHLPGRDAGPAVRARRPQTLKAVPARADEETVSRRRGLLAPTRPAAPGPAR